MLRSQVHQHRLEVEDLDLVECPAVQVPGSDCS